MGIQFEIFSLKKLVSDRPIPVKQCRVRGNKNIFKVGLIYGLAGASGIELLVAYNGS